jgi:hypothetical protein
VHEPWWIVAFEHARPGETLRSRRGPLRRQLGLPRDQDEIRVVAQHRDGPRDGPNGIGLAPQPGNDVPAHRVRSHRPHGGHPVLTGSARSKSGP